MDFDLTLVLIGIAALLIVGSGLAHARRGIGGWSLIPWDYVMLLSAVCGVALLAHLADIWRGA